MLFQSVLILFCDSFMALSIKTPIMSRVPDQNGVSLLYIMLEIHHSGWEPSLCCMHFRKKDKKGALKASLSNTSHYIYKVSGRTSWPSVHVLRLGEIASLISSIYFREAACNWLCTSIPEIYSVGCLDIKHTTNKKVCAAIRI